MRHFLYKIWYGLINDTLFLLEIAYQCKCLNDNNPNGCNDCEGTGVVKYGCYSTCWIKSMEEFGHKHIWTRWNPMAQYYAKPDKPLLD